MPQKPAPVRMSHGNTVPNEMFTAANDALMAKHGCSKATAERAIREGKVMRLERGPAILSRTLGEILGAVGELLVGELQSEPPIADGVDRCDCGVEVVGAPRCWLCSNPPPGQSRPIGGGL